PRNTGYRDVPVPASGNCQISAAKASPKRPNPMGKNLISLIFSVRRRRPTRFLPDGSGISRSPSSAERTGEGPGLLAGRARLAAEVTGLGARGGAFKSALGDALHDRRQPEEAIDHEEFPMRRPAAAGALAVGGDILVLAGNPQR